MMSKNRQYDNDYKVQAAKLAKEIGTEKAAKELNVPSNTRCMAGLKRRRSEGLISVWESETLKMH